MSRRFSDLSLFIALYAAPASESNKSGSLAEVMEVAPPVI